MVKDSFNSIFKHKSRVLAVFAHPDDAEITSGGLIARLTNADIEVRVVKTTRGNKGSRLNKTTEDKLANTREKEDQKALKTLGIKSKNNINLGLPDGEVENNLSTIDLIALHIRLFKPDLIITHNPEQVFTRFNSKHTWVNHRDHRNTALSTIDAAYPYSIDLLFFPKHFKEKGAAPHQVNEFLLFDYEQNSNTVSFEITKYVNRKIQAISCHKSQLSSLQVKNIMNQFKEKDGNYYEKFRYVKIE